jgi:hypothetical protein
LIHPALIHPALIHPALINPELMNPRCAASESQFSPHGFEERQHE